MSCESMTVAQSRAGVVSVCTCGTVSVSYGNATIRIPLREYMEFANMVDQSFTHLAEYELRMGEGM